MSEHEALVRLRHMLDYALEAMAMAADRKRGELETDRKLELSLSRLVEMIGEAANKVPEAYRRDHVRIPWRQIIGTRNRITHGYDMVDKNALWEIVTNDLSPLAEELARILRNEERV